MKVYESINFSLRNEKYLCVANIEISEKYMTLSKENEFEIIENSQALAALFSSVVAPMSEEI